MRMSTLFLRTLRDDPADADVDSAKLLARAGYIRKVAPGLYAWLPLGLKVLNKIEAIVREEIDAIGGQEVHFTAMQPREPYERTHRWEEYGENIFRFKDRHDQDYLLAPTHEEMFTLMAKDMYSSYKDLPVTLYQIQSKYRDEFRPRAGLIRGREFIMKDAYSFDVADEGLETQYQTMRDSYEKIFKRLGLDYVICSAMSGAMGGSRSEEFLHPTSIGEDTFVRAPSGYAANAEAVTTPQAEDVDFSGVPEAEVLDTPESTTIETLVAVANQLKPKDKPWTAADTLKNVVVTISHPDGEREVIVVGVPGDRDVDLKRIEAAVSPAEVEVATPEDLKKHPELVPGYIGPNVIGPNSPNRTTDEDGTISGSVRYLLDPRIARGSAWVTGADAKEKHVFNLVYGRDFEADGTIEAVEIRAGDPAPDGSGPVELERGIEIGHIFQLGRKYADNLGLTVLDENGKARVVTMGSYGLGVSRVLAALAEKNHDDLGLIWPINIAPAHVHVLATGKGAEIFETAESISDDLTKAGFEVVYDDRPKVSAGVKFKDYELLGVPYGIVVGRGLADGKVEIRTRATGESLEVSVAEASAKLAEMLRADLAAHGE